MCDPDFHAALDSLQELYLELADRLESLSLSCRACGECCHFENFDYVLYASTLERDLILRQARELGLKPAPVRPGRCPWQEREGGRCRIHPFRPLGCRVHFCLQAQDSPRAASSLEKLAGQMHSALQQLHRTREIAWQYRPFLAG